MQRNRAVHGHNECKCYCYSEFQNGFRNHYRPKDNDHFYPADDTEGCTVEACEFRDHWAAVRKMGTVVLGVSPDGVASHGKFRKKYQLPFPLLADEDHAVAAKYGVWGEKSMFGRKYFGVKRTTFLIDEAGRIAKVFERVRPKGHAAQVLEALR